MLSYAAGLPRPIAWVIVIAARVIDVFQPFVDFVGGLFLRSASRLLRRVAPALEVFADRADRHVDAIFVADQVANGTPRPQRRGNAPIVGVMPLELCLEMGGLRFIERSSRTQRPSGSVLRNRVQAALLVSGPPPADRFAAQPE